MMTRYQVWLNGRALHELAPGVCILDVREQPPVLERQTVNHAEGHGSLLTRCLRRSLTVQVAFAIRETAPAIRAAALQQVLGWMRGGGSLTVNTRPSQMLMVQPSRQPICASADDWTETLYAEFTAYERPFWQSCAPTALHVQGNGGGTLVVPGTAEETACSLEVTNPGSEVCGRLTVTAGDTRFVFEQLALAPGETLRCSHDEHARLRIVILGSDGMERSAYHLRSGMSHDELLLPCGAASAVSVEADVPVCTLLTARGCWL